MAAAGHKDRSQIALARRKAQDRLIALVLTGIVLLFPPLGAISLVESPIAGLPVPLIYLFAVWAILIGVAGFLSRALSSDDEPAAFESEAPDAGS